jgi:hypothetical protein
MALTKHETAVEIGEICGLGTTTIKNVLDALAQVAAEELAAGEDFTVPGIVKVRWTYRSALAKGERWKKGAEVVGFGGIASVKDSDSPARKASIGMRASLVGTVNKLKPKKAEMSTFMKTKTAKAVATRVGR